MKFSELVTMFESYTGTSDEIDDAQLALWFNEAQNRIALSLGKVTEYTFESAVADTAYSLPAACLKLLAVSDDYSIDTYGRVTFVNGGDVVVTYRSIPTVYFTGTGSDEESDLPTICHNLIAIFAASRYWDMESEGDEYESMHATKYMQYFFEGLGAIVGKTDIGGSVSVDRWVVEVE